MPRPERTPLSDLRGAARMAVDATAGVAEIVEKMHRTIQLLPGPLGRPAVDRTRGITGLVYRCIRGGIRLTGQGIDASLAQVAALLGEGQYESTPALDTFKSVVNGLYGDYLVRTDNPFAMEMSLRYRSRRVDAADPASIREQSGNTPSPAKLLVLVHGLCLNERQWAGDGHDHGQALADSLGYVPLYLRYNTGLRVASNGRALAETLEALVTNWTSPVSDLVIIGHSMGGLVARSACHYGCEAGHSWPQQLRKLVFLGTPHHGTPLERAGRWVDSVLELSPYSAPFALIGKIRSAGINDLRSGSITCERHKPVPLPTDVTCYAAAATLAAPRSALSTRLLGDGLVPLNSALGRHRDATRTLAIAGHRQWIGYGTGHRKLLNCPEVYAQLQTWLQETD